MSTKNSTLTGPQQKFCEGVVSGLNGTEAYASAYPRATRSAARAQAARLLTKPSIQQEIARMRNKAEEMAGSAVMTLKEKREFLARLVRSQVGRLPGDSDLWNSIKTTEIGTEYRLPDKLKAIELDNDLAGEGSEAEGQDALAQLLERVMK
jgi:hypothetical protein